jgi:hypothetical protein
MDQILQTHVENVQSSHFQHIRSDRFREIRTSSLSAEWSVSDCHVIKKSQNYRNSLIDTWIKVKYLSIVGTMLVHFIFNMTLNKRSKMKLIFKI